MGVLKYINQLIAKIKELIGNNKITLGDFHTPLTSMEKSYKQKIINETIALNETLDQMDLTDIFRTFHPKAADCTLFSSVHGTFSRVHHILHHKAGLNKYNKNECIYIACHNVMKLEVHQKKRKIGKHHKYMEVKKNPNKE